MTLIISDITKVFKMKATLKIECIGDNDTQFLKFWKSGSTAMVGEKLTECIFGNIPQRFFVAEILGLHPKFNFERNFIRYKKDYKHSISKGSRGIFAYYILETDKIYEVKEPISWSKTDRYFCIVNEEGDIIKITKETVEKCLRSQLE